MRARIGGFSSFFFFNLYLAKEILLIICHVCFQSATEGQEIVAQPLLILVI